MNTEMDADAVRQVVKRVKELVREGIQHGDLVICAPMGYCDDYSESIAIDRLRKAWDIMISLLERLGTDFLLDRAKREYEAFSKDPLYSEMGVDDPFLVWPWKIQDYAEAAATIFAPVENVDLPQNQKGLVELLEAMETYLTDPRLFTYMPSCEDDVHTRIEGVLKCSYDVSTKPRLAKSIKNFEPDSAIRSLKTLIEYKYISCENDAKKVVDEILADLSGYHEAGTHKHLIFVIYETQRVRPWRDWKQVIDDAPAKDSVSVVLLKGSTPRAHDQKMSEDHRKAAAVARKGVGSKRKTPPKKRSVPAKK